MKSGYRYERKFVIALPQYEYFIISDSTVRLAIDKSENYFQIAPGNIMQRMIQWLSN